MLKAETIQNSDLFVTKLHLRPNISKLLFDGCENETEIRYIQYFR